MDRRDFLKHMGAALGLGLISACSFSPLSSGWAASLSPDASLNKKRLIVLFLRGAVDGLSIVAPYTEANYYAARPNIAIPLPSKNGGLQNLDGQFGLHPSLVSLMPFWQEKSLTFVHASGSPDPSRSHFDAQDYMETGTPGNNFTRDGWMNRLLGVMLESNNPLQAVSLGETIPRILSGPTPVANFPLGRGATQAKPVDRPDVEKVFDDFYNSNDRLSHMYQEGLQARREILGDLDAETKAANNGAPLPNGFSLDAMQLSQLIKKDPRVDLAFLALGGWDTHVNQGSSNGQLASHLQPLGQGLATLVQGLGPVYNNTVIVVMSEFGRTFHENGDGGTDHGHGNVMWLLGGPVQGGKVYGQWPGLAPEQLYQNRDLAITTDFRSVITTVIHNHLGLGTNQFGPLFPGFDATKNRIDSIIHP